MMVKSLRTSMGALMISGLLVSSPATVFAGCTLEGSLHPDAYWALTPHQSGLPGPNPVTRIEEIDRAEKAPEAALHPDAYWALTPVTPSIPPAGTAKLEGGTKAQSGS